MIAAPRLATVGMKVFSIQSWSPTTSAAFLPPTSAWKMSGYCVAEWLPQIVIFLMSVTAAPVLAASCEIARLWSRRVSAENRSCGMSGALVIAISALVLAGLPVTPMRTSSAATLLSALPCAVKIAPLAESRSPRSMPGPRGRAPTSSARLTPSKICLGVVADLDAGEVRERAVVELHDDALERLERRRDLQQPQLDRAVAEQRPARETEEQAVADLAGGAGDGDLQRGRAHDDSLNTRREDGGFPPPDASSGGTSSHAPIAVLGCWGHDGVRTRARRCSSCSVASPGCGSAARPRARPRASTSSSIPTPSPDPADFVRRRRQPVAAAARRRAPGPTQVTDVDGAHPLTVTVGATDPRSRGVATTARVDAPSRRR